MVEPQPVVGALPPPDIVAPEEPGTTVEFPSGNGVEGVERYIEEVPVSTVERGEP